MRVLVVAPRLEIGGTEMHLARLLPRLRTCGVDVSVFAISRGGSLETKFLQEGVPVDGIAANGPRALASLRATLMLRRAIHRFRPDILHFFLPEPYLIGSLAGIGYNNIIKIMSRRSLSHYQRKHPVLAYLERRLHRSLDALIGNSSAVASELVEECCSPEKVGVIHNGIELPSVLDAEARFAHRRELGIPHDAFVIVVVANLIPYKGHADLFAALGVVRNRLTAPWRLMLIGRDQGTGVDLRRRAHELGIAENVLWLGECSDSQALIPLADLGVLPSHQEGFSNSLIEKMAHGLPVVATSVGGNIDAVMDCETGYLVPVSNVPALGEAIAALYESAGLRARMGAAGRLRIERLFSLEACVRHCLNLYRGLLEGRHIPVTELIDPPARTAPVSVLQK